MSETIVRNIHWNERLEKYLAETGEKAHCYSWLNKKAEELFSIRSIFIDLPVIILGVFNGATSIGSTALFTNTQMSSVIIGVIALLTSLLTTVGTYFAFARRAESHKMIGIQYAKLYRFIYVELNLPRTERTNPDLFLKYVKEQYDRLAEISPLIPKNIILEFNNHFNTPEYKNISKPEITNGIHSIQIFPVEVIELEVK